MRRLRCGFVVSDMVSVGVDDAEVVTRSDTTRHNMTQCCVRIVIILFTIYGNVCYNDDTIIRPTVEN